MITKTNRIFQNNQKNKKFNVSIERISTLKNTFCSVYSTT